ncbi:maleylpyruvate isomerase N-terminal domain-containing protein [Saccharopolyspora indica]|uniref:maleylpyruvate isomerase N-terminal domain-containing protein n=1 Tax=Saccharopolyspora indica TaxID=1229659 RepID=UPI0022EA7E55|nr:maleylpyruvate isomerase N-terminal domain-containing protein [Saccharopolyspora indica]MDA3646417.1 maleylpyruvate isomerase N-terminal domain-containing protein [Saccharopolyspora indica]
MIVDALDQAWQAWAALGRVLAGDQWQRPTRLPDWTVRDVYAHHCDFPAGTAAGLAAPEPTAPVSHADAAELLAFMQQPGGIADQTCEEVRTTAIQRAGAGELVEQFTDRAPAVIAALRETDLDRKVDYTGFAVVTAGEALRIFLMEAVVHYFDIATALDLPVPGPMAGSPLRETVRLLAETADPVALVDAATGRSTPQVFPVLH